MILQSLTRLFEDLVQQGKLARPGWSPAKIRQPGKCCPHAERGDRKKQNAATAHSHGAPLRHNPFQRNCPLFPLG